MRPRPKTRPPESIGSPGSPVVRQGRQALAAVLLEGFERRPISDLSAGRFQRVLFVRLLLEDSPVLQAWERPDRDWLRNVPVSGHLQKK